MKTDYNSSRNQEIKGKLVAREVITSVNELIEHLQGCESHDYTDEVMSVSESINYEQTICGYLDSLDEDELAELAEDEDIEVSDSLTMWNAMTKDDDEFISDHDCDIVYDEVYEYWAVTPWMGRKLKEFGESVEDIMGFTVWGRCTTGQAILLDGVISRIAEDMEILDGMANEW